MRGVVEAGGEKPPAIRFEGRRRFLMGSGSAQKSIVLYN
jgi:hypothetical protein